MKVKLILLPKDKKKKVFVIRLSNGKSKKYKTVKVPFTEKEWKHNPKKRVNELRKVSHKPNGTKEDNTRYNTYIKNREFVDDLEKQYSKKINDLIRLGDEFSADRVVKLVHGLETNTTFPNTIHKIYEHKIQEQKELKKYGNASAYKSSYGKFKSFQRKDILIFDVDIKLIEKYKNSMIEQNLSPATISIHLRNLRAIYSYALKNGVGSYDRYPFRHTDIMKGLSGGRRSLALVKSEVDGIRDIRTKLEVDSPLWEACSIFILGYVAWGINFQDIARLTMKDIKNNRITYVRFKTRGKISDTISPPITTELREIIDHYTLDKDKTDKSYVFPFLNESHSTEQKKYNRIQKMRKELNKSLKLLGEEINPDINISTYTWRHSFATISKNELNVPIEKISEMLGHSSLAVTKAYLDQFPDRQKDEITKEL